MTTRRDFLKLCAVATAVAVTSPSLRPAPSFDPDTTSLLIQFMSLNDQLMGQAESRPEDGEYSDIEFDAEVPGIIKCVVVRDLDTGRELCQLWPGKGLTMNSTHVMTGDMVRLSGIRVED